MYNFDMNALLTAFDNDPENLAKAFTESLNKELEIRNKAKEVQKIADEAVVSWNSFVSAYCDFYKIDNKENYFFQNGVEIIDIFKIILETIPEVERYLKVAEKVAPAIEKAETTLTDFEETMKDFFKKYNI